MIGSRGRAGSREAEKKFLFFHRIAGWGGGAVDAGCLEVFLAAALSRVMRAAVS